MELYQANKIIKEIEENIFFKSVNRYIVFFDYEIKMVILKTSDLQHTDSITQSIIEEILEIVIKNDALFFVALHKNKTSISIHEK